VTKLVDLGIYVDNLHVGITDPTLQKDLIGTVFEYQECNLTNGIEIGETSVYVAILELKECSITVHGVGILVCVVNIF
jgi:hypothetical protein